MSSTNAPLYPCAILFPIFAFPSWILCIPPLFWHFHQGNIAAGSLFLWVIMVNFFNSINPLIWPRDNLDEWWNGNVWCDINVRLQIGATAGTTASAAMIVRKLAKVMDTRNITITPSRASKMKEKILEIVWCWVYPVVLVLIYYIVQPIRYFIYGIVGCWSAYDDSWLSIVLGGMWPPITILVATGYAGKLLFIQILILYPSLTYPFPVLLSYRLYRYRREFVRLVAARNTTKSRFIRLFAICIIIIAAYVPYTLWLLSRVCRTVTAQYSWQRNHDPATFNSIVKIPVNGTVTVDKWGQVASGYVLFFVFGTGSDAYNTYKKMLLLVGLGRVFPSLHVMRESGANTPNSFINARSWTESLSSKAKSIFWSRSNSVTEETSVSGTRHEQQHVREISWFGRLFGQRSRQLSVLPVFLAHRKRSVAELTVSDTHKRDISSGASAPQCSVDGDVRVFHEVRLECQELDEQATDRPTDDVCVLSVKGGAGAV
jgi:pheromone a factor receptor